MYKFIKDEQGRYVSVVYKDNHIGIISPYLGFRKAGRNPMFSFWDGVAYDGEIKDMWREFYLWWEL